MSACPPARLPACPPLLSYPRTDQFMFGAWAFMIGNYLIYFQLINKAAAHGDRRASYAVAGRGACRSFATWPKRESGHLGSLFNLIGASFFIINTMAMFRPPAEGEGVNVTVTDAEKEAKNIDFNLWYVMTGGVGSFFFVLGAICEGEHNHWRQSPWKHITELPILMSFLNFFGGVLFLVAYVVDFSGYADKTCADGDCDATVWGVAGTFTTGSIFFLISSWMSLWMWKQQNFGLGFAKEMVGRSMVKVDLKQQIMIVFYCANICLSWCRLGFVFSRKFENESMEHALALDAGLKLLAYHCIMFLASALHTTPKRHPFNYIFWCMRIIAIYGFVSEVYIVHEMAVDGTQYEGPHMQG